MFHVKHDPAHDAGAVFHVKHRPRRRSYLSFRQSRKLLLPLVSV